MKPGQRYLAPNIQISKLKAGEYFVEKIVGVEILHTFSFFHFSFSREKELRVCGAEVEWTLQKYGGGFEFTIQNIACHSLAHPFLH